MQEYKVFEMLYRFFSNRTIEEGETAIYKKSDDQYELCEVLKVEDSKNRLYLIKVLSTQEIIKTNKVIPIWTIDNLEEFLIKVLQFINNVNEDKFDILINQSFTMLSDEAIYTALIVKNGIPVENMVFSSSNYDTLLANIVLKFMEEIIKKADVKDVLSL